MREQETEGAFLIERNGVEGETEANTRGKTELSEGNAHGMEVARQ
jgi:hypothetical protein